MVCDHIILVVYYWCVHRTRWQNKTVDEKKQQDEIFAVGMYLHTYGIHRLHTS